MAIPSTGRLQNCIDRIHSGDATAREELLRLSRDRLRMLSSRMLRQFPAVRRWEDTDDVLQQFLLRIDRTDGKLDVGTARDYLRLSATVIRRLLIDLARHYTGPRGLGANYASPVPDPSGSADNLHGQAVEDPASGPEEVAIWAEFHEQVSLLPTDEQEVIDLLWYNGLGQEEAAGILGISLSTLKRRWQSARLHLIDVLGRGGFLTNTDI